MAWRDWIKRLNSNDKEAKIVDDARGVAVSAPAQTDTMGVSGFGNDAWLSSLGRTLAIDTDLMLRYIDYENMDDYPTTSEALDRAADDSTIPDSVHGKTIWGASDDRIVRDIIDDVLHRRIRIDEDIWPAVRTLCKYGNGFGEILVNEAGVVGLNWLPTPTMRRIVDEKGALLGFVQDVRGTFNFDYEAVSKQLSSGSLPRVKDEEKTRLIFFRPWEVVHWRLRSKNMNSQYGFSFYDAARWIFKRLTLMEDSALVQKLTRGPRFAYYVDTGDLPPREAMAMVRKVKNGFKKKKFIDPNTGQLELKYNVMCLTGDTLVPQLDGSEKTIIEMAEAFEVGKKQWVYGVDRDAGNKIVPGEVIWAGKTRKDAELVRVTLDNGESFRVTPDHKCILRDGTTIEAQNLEPGDSMMPLRRKLSVTASGKGLQGYEMVYDPASKRYRYTHRVVAKAVGIYEKGKIIHHDRHKLNNDPSELKSMTREDHCSHHCMLGEIGGARVTELRKVDKDLDRRLRDAASRTMKRLHRDPAYLERKRIRISRQNIERNSSKHIIEYNNSSKHAENNVLRSDMMKAHWAVPANREAMSEKKKYVFTEDFIAAVRDIVLENPMAGAEDVSKAAESGQAMDILREDNDERFIPGIHRHLLLNAYRMYGFDSFEEFRASALVAFSAGKPSSVSLDVVVKGRNCSKVHYPDNVICGMELFIRENPCATIADIGGHINNGSLFESIVDANPRAKVNPMCKDSVVSAVESRGYRGIGEFKEAALSFNHKIVSVERLVEREDTYTLTVDKCHTFGLSAGVIVCNSAHEDLWIPTRGQKESTRIEVMSGLDINMVDEMEYFQNKLYKSLKMPKDDDGGDSSQTLASQDARFARACMRIQREFIMGMRKVVRIHMAALNIDPGSTEWQLKMTVPSAIFEMQQIEVMNAQAALASSMAEWMSKPWIMQHILHLSEDDALLATKAKDEEGDRDAKREAETQADIIKMYPELQELPPAEEEANESNMSAELNNIKKVLQEASQGNPEMVKMINRLESKVVNLDKTIKRTRQHVHPGK